MTSSAGRTSTPAAGWLIFRTGASELGVHPTDHGGGQHHQISLMCDDIEATVAELRDKGVEFTQDVRDDGFGLTAMFAVPGGGEMMIYEPRHPTPTTWPDLAARAPLRYGRRTGIPRITTTMKGSHDERTQPGRPARHAWPASRVARDLPSGSTIRQFE